MRWRLRSTDFAHAHPRAPTADAIEGYLARVASSLHAPAAAREAILAELRAGLLDAVDAHQHSGRSALRAQQAGIREFGDPVQVAAAFAPELAASRTRRVAMLLLASAPMIALAWAAAAFGSHIGARPAPPWQWPHASPASSIALVLATAAFLVGICAAMAALALSGRLTRWIPAGLRVAPASVSAAVLAAGTVDVILLILLSHQLARAPGKLDTTPVAIATAASIARLVCAPRAARQCRSHFPRLRPHMQ